MGSEIASRTFAELNTVAKAKSWPMRCDGELGFERAELRDLLVLWQSKAVDGVPARSVFDMRSLRPFAAHVVILECEGGGGQRRYKFRLFGSAHSKLFGEHTGRYLDEMVASELLPSWHAFYDAVLTAREPLRIVTHFRTPAEVFLKGEIFAAPMANGDGAVCMILAATYISHQDVAPPPFG